MTDNFLNFYEKIFFESDAGNRTFTISGWSYNDIYRLASGIKNIFPGKENDSLCLCSERKAVIIAAILASIAGGPSIVIPYSYNERVLDEIKRSADFDSILTDNPEKIPGGIEIITPEMCEAKDERLSAIRDPDSSFLKLFTGGSTGDPRGWTKSPRNLFSEAVFLSEKFNITEKDIFVSTVPPQHIYGLLFSILLPFVSRARVYDNVCAFPQEIISAVDSNSATVLVSIPMHYRALKESLFRLPSLRCAFSSGGTLDNADAENFFRKSSLEVTEVFGSTETGGIAFRLNSGKGGSWDPFDNVEWKTANERLLVKSDFISKELPTDDGGFFITGDRALSDGAGSFNTLGRADGVVKVAGRRVDLNSVVNKIKQISGVDEAVVISIPSPHGRENIIAALVEGKIDYSELKKILSRNLEHYEVPRRLKIIDKIPRTSAGKYDRQKITAILESHPE